MKFDDKTSNTESAHNRIKARTEKNFVKLNPNRIKEARIAKGFSLHDLSLKMGISRQFLSLVEKGKKGLSPENRTKLALYLNKPISFFTQADSDDFLPLTPIFFRKVKSISQKKQATSIVKIKWVLRLYNLFDNYLELPQPNIPDFQIEDFENIKDHEIEDYAIETRKHWGLGKGPISDIQLLFDNNGIVTVNFDIPEKLDGFSLWQQTKEKEIPLIVIAKNLPCARYRMNLAHELGHLILHQSVSDEALKEKETFNKIEKQAFRFAGAFLMPEESFRKEVFSLRISDLIQLKKRWKVSIAAIIYRLDTLKIIDNNHKTRLNIELSSKGYKRKEPLDDEIKTEEPKLLMKAVNTLTKHNIMTPIELKEALHLEPEDMAEITNMDKEKFIPNKLNNIYDFKIKV